MNCEGLTTFAYEFDSIGYCSIGKDYNLKHFVVEITPNEGVPDFDQIVELVKEMDTCPKASTEERTQFVADTFFEICRPKKVVVTSTTKNMKDVIYTVRVEKDEK